MPKVETVFYIRAIYVVKFNIILMQVRVGLKNPTFYKGMLCIQQKLYSPTPNAPWKTECAYE
jgi:hypothetical protein